MNAIKERTVQNKINGDEIKNDGDMKYLNDEEFIFLVNNSKTKNMLPFLIKSETNPVFFLTGANILEHELIENEDGIGKELYVKCEIVP